MADENEPPDLSDNQDRNPGKPSIIAAIREDSWSAPLPRPRDLAQYNAIVPSGAERIFALTEQEAQFRREIIRKETDLECWDRKAARICAFVFAMSALGSAVYCAMLGMEVTAGIIGGTTMIAVVTALIKRE